MGFVKLPVLCNGLTVRHEDILSEDAVRNRIESARKLMKRLNLKALLVYRDGAVNGAVCYLTHYPGYRIGRRALVVLGLDKGPFLYTAEPSRNIPRVRLFTACDLEDARDFFYGACKQAREIAGGGTIGLVGGETLSAELYRKMQEVFSGAAVSDVSTDFYALMAVKDKSGLEAEAQALKRARKGLDILNENLKPGKDIWRLYAQVDYQLRLAGCECTNILLGCAAGGKVRPGYPARESLRPGDLLVAYIAVRYARHWGVVGRTFSIAAENRKLQAKLDAVKNLQGDISAKIKAGMTLEQIETEIRSAGRQCGLVFAEDLPLVAGIGFDLSEYPASAPDRVGQNTLLQVVLAVDDAQGNFTALRADMLLVGDSGAAWLQPQDD